MLMYNVYNILSVYKLILLYFSNTCITYSFIQFFSFSKIIYVIFILEKMSFSVRFNAEDEEVEGLCTIPTKIQSTGIYTCIDTL